jgi:hypothetical protein
MGDINSIGIFLAVILVVTILRGGITMPTRTKITLSVVILCVLFFLLPTAESQNPIQVTSGHPRIFITQESLPELRSRAATTHKDTYTILKNWCDTYWSDTNTQNRSFGLSDRYYDAGMLRYALIYALGEIPGFSYSTHSINDYGDKARDIMLSVVRSTSSPNWLEFVSYTYDWVNMASPKDGSYRMNDTQKQTVVGWFYSIATGTPQRPMYIGYTGLFVPNSFYPGLAFYGDGVGGSYGGVTADQLAQTYVGYIPTYLTYFNEITNESGTGGGNKNGLCYSNYVWFGQFNIGSILRSLYVMTTATNLTASETYNYYTAPLQTAIWFIYGTQPGPKHTVHYSGANDVPLMLWDDCGLLSVANLSGGDIAVTMSFKLAAMLYGMIGNIDYQQLIYWFLNAKLNVTANDSTFDILLNPRNVSTSLPSSVSPVKPFGWDTVNGVIDHWLTNPKGGIGEIHMKSSLDFSTDSTVAVFRASPYFYTGDHDHYDSLAFSIFKKEPLALPNSGKYYGFYEGNDTYPVIGFPHKYHYYQRTVGVNSLLIMDPSDVTTSYIGGYTNTYRDGGQRTNPVTNTIWGKVIPNSDADWGGLTHFEDGTNYTYSSADATKGYASTKAALVQRDFIYLKGESGANDYFVVFDRIDSKDATFKKVFLLHTIGEPVLDGTSTQTFGGASGGLYQSTNSTSATITMPTAKLFMKSLLPISRLVYKMGGTATTTTTQSLDNSDDGTPFDINVSSSADFSPNPIVTIDYEGFTCTGKSTGKLTGCLRGYHYWKSNNPVSHSSGATVKQEFPWMFREVDTGKWINYPHDFGQAHGSDYMDTLDEFGKWALRIETTDNVVHHNFLNVFHPSINMNESSMAATSLITSSSGNMQGVLIADGLNPRIVMFSPTTAQVSDVTYGVNYSSSQAGKHLITGLVPFAGYDIYKNGTKIASTPASSQGIVSFESVGGSTFRLVQTSGPTPPPVPSPPTPPPDTTPPVRSNGLPAGALPSGTVQAILSLSTNENATCKYSLTPGVSYSLMKSTFSTTGGTAHSTTVSGLSNGTSYNYYVRCMDTANNANLDDYAITFSVASSPTPPSPPQSGYVINDFNFYPTPNVARPAKGVGFLDTIYHSKITRITDAPNQCYNSSYGAYCWDCYPKFSNENCDGTKLIIGQIGGSCYNLFDETTTPYTKVKAILNKPNVCGGNVDPRWDATDPNILYYSYYGKFYKYDVRDDSEVLLHDFGTDFPPTHKACSGTTTVCTQNSDCPGSTCVNYPVCTQTMAEEGDSSTDSRYWAFGIVCNDPAYYPVYGNNNRLMALVTYDKDYSSKNNGQIISTFKSGDAGWDTMCFGTSVSNCYNSSNMSPNGDYFFLDSDWIGYAFPSHNLSAASAITINSNGHADFAIDNTGAQVWVSACSVPKTGTKVCQWSPNTNDDLWVKMTDIATGEDFWLANLGTATTQDMFAMYHVSGNARTNTGWAVFSTWGPNFTSTTHDWTGHEIFAVELTRTPPARIWNIAQTHTLTVSGNPLNFDPFGKINKAGTKIFFGSNWDANVIPGSGQYDVYQIDLPATWYQDLMGFNILTSSMIAGTMSLNYSQTLQASGGIAPYTWSLLSGTLPSGLSLNASTGVISGTPTIAGTSNFTIQVKDSSSPAKTGSKTFPITVNAASDTTPPVPPKGLKIMPNS